ncbi:MAG TPA: hypothetical protein P5127_06480, partial [Oscillospiraceae bacterium]|nr:hypothetical protein [Oscillospiraceae bacterium]
VFDGGKNTRRSKAKHNMEARKFESGIAKCLNAHEANIRHFVDVITKGVEPVFTVDQGVDMIKILMGIYESAKTGKEVVL